MYVGLEKNTVQCYCLLLIPNYLRKMQSVIYIRINGYMSISNDVGVGYPHE